jgi:hypothetical protein
MMKKPTLWEDAIVSFLIFIVWIMLFASIILNCSGCNKNLPRTSGEGGFIQNRSGEDLFRAEFPVEICPKQPSDLFNKGALWWNSQMSREGTSREVLVISCSKPVLVTVEYLDEDEEYLGWCHYRFDIFNRLHRTQVTVDPDLSTERTFKVIIHEFGHVLGLDEDAYDPESNSIMSGSHVLNPEVSRYDYKILSQHYDLVESIRLQGE